MRLNFFVLAVAIASLLSLKVFAGNIEECTQPDDLAFMACAYSHQDHWDPTAGVNISDSESGTLGPEPYNNPNIPDD